MAKDNDMFTYVAKGHCRAYVQFRQEVPEGFERLTLRPVEEFYAVAPPRIGM